MGDARLREIPNAKPQIPEKFQIPIRTSSVSASLLELGSLEFLWCLELGSWSLPNANTLVSDNASRHDCLHRLAVIVREPEIAAVVAIGEFLVVETEQAQNRRVQVVDVHLVLD